MTKPPNEDAAQMPTAESMEDAEEIVSASLSGGKIRRALLIENLAEALDTAACRSCGSSVAHGNAIDRDPELNRHHRAVSGCRLRGKEWLAFEFLYLHRRPIVCEELSEAGIWPANSANEQRHNMRTLMWSLRRKLRGSPFRIVTDFRHTESTAYELVDARTESRNA